LISILSPFLFLSFKNDFAQRRKEKHAKIKQHSTACFLPLRHQRLCVRFFLSQHLPLTQLFTKLSDSIPRAQTYAPVAQWLEQRTQFFERSKWKILDYVSLHGNSDREASISEIH